VGKKCYKNGSSASIVQNPCSRRVAQQSEELALATVRDAELITLRAQDIAKGVGKLSLGPIRLEKLKDYVQRDQPMKCFPSMLTQV